MMGHVDQLGRALISVSIRPSSVVAARFIEAWIDTGFTGDLVLPQQLINDLSLPQTGTVKAILADGSDVALKRFACLVDWLGEERELEVIANDGDFPLLGVGLLVGRDLHVSYRTGQIMIN